MHPKVADGMANSVDPDEEQFDLGLQCLPMPVCPKTEEQYETRHEKTCFCPM